MSFLVDLKGSEKNVLLYTSLNKQLIQGMFAADAMVCPSVGLGTVPLKPIQLPSYSNKKLDVHIGYDPVENMIYFSDETVIRKASADDISSKDRVKDTGEFRFMSCILRGAGIRQPYCSLVILLNEPYLWTSIQEMSYECQCCHTKMLQA